MYVRMESFFFLVLLKYICHFFIYQLVMHTNTINQIWLTHHLDNLESFHFFSNKTFFLFFAHLDIVGGGDAEDEVARL